MSFIHNQNSPINRIQGCRVYIYNFVIREQNVKFNSVTLTHFHGFVVSCKSTFPVAEFMLPGNKVKICQFSPTIILTRMHSSRMRTVRNSSRLLGGEGVPGPGGQTPPPPVNRMTDRCKNIAFATSLRTVKVSFDDFLIAYLIIARFSFPPTYVTT